MNKIIKEDLDFIINYNLSWKEFKGRTFLISGAYGLLPSYFIRTLLYLNDHQY